MIILGLWRLIFFAAKRTVSKSDRIVLGCILLVGLLFGLVLYPSFFGWEYDNYSNFLMARRFIPTYWHGMYTGVLYAGCLAVLPHPIALFLFQWLSFWAVVSYLYLGIGRLYGNGIRKYLVLLLFLLPESYYVTYNPYRNNMYTILVLFYFSYLYFSAKRADGIAGLKEILFFSLLTSFVMVWRSEGILLGLGGIVVYLFFVLELPQKKHVKPAAVLLVAASVFFLVFSRIQALGEKKYYGRDYMIINTTNILGNILNCPWADLSYAGAEDDLRAIDAIVPTEIVRACGAEGYRSYNWTNGRTDYNQTLAPDSQAAAYMSAYCRIVLHNLDLFFGTQTNHFFQALQLPANHPTYPYEGDLRISLAFLEDFPLRVGREELRETWFTSRWENNEKRIMLVNLAAGLIGLWRGLVEQSGLNRLMHTAALLLPAILFLLELLRVIDGKKRFRDSAAYMLSFLVILGECGAILLVMPEGRPAYLYPMLYAAYLMIFLCFAERPVPEKSR
ncbi:MAG: hypothetical protein K6F56_00265 [Oscillospiraceae bacterium]|nr:hypothetical protein [Oscillospiraceae bacterium]